MTEQGLRMTKKRDWRASFNKTYGTDCQINKKGRNPFLKRAGFHRI